MPVSRTGVEPPSCPLNQVTYVHSMNPSIAQNSEATAWTSLCLKSASLALVFSLLLTHALILPLNLVFVFSYPEV